MLILRYLKAGKTDSIKITDRSFEGGKKFKYLGTTQKDKNCMHDEIKSGLISGNAS
jgi:hypothetical protein